MRFGLLVGVFAAGSFVLHDYVSLSIGLTRGGPLTGLGGAAARQADVRRWKYLQESK